jgi:hypothetical protein
MHNRIDAARSELSFQVTRQKPLRFLPPLQHRIQMAKR